MAAILALAVAAVALVLILRDAESGSSSYRVDAVFDNARGLVGGQVVKVAHRPHPITSGAAGVA